MCGRREVGVYGELSGVGLLLSPAPRDFHAGPCRPKIFDPESKELFFFFPPILLVIQDLSSPTRDQTCGPCSGCVGS